MAVEVPATTAANYVVNLGAVGIVGVFFGMPMQDIVVGGMAGAVRHGVPVLRRPYPGNGCQAGPADPAQQHMLSVCLP